MAVGLAIALPTAFGYVMLNQLNLLPAAVSVTVNRPLSVKFLTPQVRLLVNYLKDDKSNTGKHIPLFLAALSAGCVAALTYLQGDEYGEAHAGIKQVSFIEGGNYIARCPPWKVESRGG